MLSVAFKQLTYTFKKVIPMYRSSLFIILTCCILTACNNNRTEINSEITIAGKVTGMTDGAIRIYSDEELAGTRTGTEGDFEVSFISDIPEYFTFRTSETTFSLYLHPGDSIFISYDSKNPEQTFQASGDRTKEAEYLMKKRALMTESGLANIAQLASQNPDDYLMKKETGLTLLKEHASLLEDVRGIDREFVELELKGIDYQDIYLDLIYPMYHRSVMGLSADEEIDFSEEKTSEKIASTDMNNSMIIISPMGRQLLDMYMNSLLTQARNRNNEALDGDNSAIIFVMNAADSLFSNPAVRDHLKFNALKGNMEYRGPSRYEKLYTRFLEENTTPEYSEKIKTIVEKWEPISPGKEVPDFTFTDIDGNEVKLSDLKGKLVYIDVWATWCGPCLGEHPHWNELMKEYETKDVAFLTISIDNTRDPWVKMVIEKNMEGYTWFAEDAWQSEIARHFMINGIPRFLLLDMEGKVLDPSAERPSGKIRETLNQHL